MASTERIGNPVNMYGALFLAFAQIGVMTFGGGYAMLPILQRELEENRGWVTREELTDYFAIGQCTPGIIAINTATFIGYKQKGVLGGICATLGMVFPCLVIISILAGIITAFSHLQWVAWAFAGIRVCVCVQIFNAVRGLYQKSVVDNTTMGLFVVVLALTLVVDVSPVWFIIGAGLVGLYIQSRRVAG